MSGEDASHPEGVGIPPDEPIQRVEAQKVRWEVGGQRYVRDVHASDGHEGIAQYEIHGVCVRPLEAFLRYDRLDLALRRQRRGIGIEGIVRAHPVPTATRVGILGGGRWYDILLRARWLRGGPASFSHGFVWVGIVG